MIQETIQAKWTTDTQSKIYHDSINIRYNVFIVEQNSQKVQTLTLLKRNLNILFFIIKNKNH